MGLPFPGSRCGLRRSGLHAGRLRGRASALWLLANRWPSRHPPPQVEYAPPPPVVGWLDRRLRDTARQPAMSGSAAAHKSAAPGLTGCRTVPQRGHRLAQALERGSLQSAGEDAATRECRPHGLDSPMTSPWRLSVAPMMNWTDRHRFIRRLLTHRAAHAEMVMAARTALMATCRATSTYHGHGARRSCARSSAAAEADDDWRATCARPGRRSGAHGGDQPQLRLPQQTRAARRLRRLPDVSHAAGRPTA